MALGPDNFNLTIALKSLFCFQGDDIDDVFDEDSEPYLWVIMVKIDAEGLHQDGNFLVGNAVTFFSPGSHGNIGGSMTGRQTRTIPPAVGTWQTSLQPIPISVAGQQLTTIPGTIISCAVLMEENLTPGSSVEAGHQSVNNLVKATVASTLASMGLAGLAADAAAEVATQAAQGNTITLQTAAQRTLTRRLKPIQDLFTIAAPATVVVNVLQNLNLGGFIGTAVDSDKPMGVFTQTFGQAQLAQTFSSSTGMSAGSGVDINSKMWNMPEWAYTLHGEAFAHHQFLTQAQPLPAANRLQVKCSSKRSVMDGSKRITGIGGVENGAAWFLGRAQAADLIRTGQKTFFVLAPDGHSVDVAAVQGGFAFGRPWFYLQTSADQVTTNNLLGLPNCPPPITHELWF